MKYLALFTFIFLTSFCKAQGTIGSYSFIEVPDRFEFLSGDNPYQLSDMMVFYLEKKGMKAYRESETPDVSKCEILYADIERGSNLFVSKLSIIIKDCNNRILFRSQEGKSKEKAYAKSYPDALRKAFSSVAKKDIDVSNLTNTTLLQEDIEKENPIENVEVKTTISEIAIQKLPLEKEKSTPVKNEMNWIPVSLFSNYSLNGQSYLLKKVANGFTLFLTQEENDNFVKVGDIKIIKAAAFTMTDLYGENKSGYFNANQDVVIKLSNGNELVYTKEL